jgi:conjugal transfer pilus assembly protein TraA
MNNVEMMECKEVQHSSMKKQKILAIGLFALCSAAALAGTDDTFSGLSDMIIGWAEGSLGITLSVIGLIFGIGAGVAKGTAVPAVMGIAFAMVCSMGPSIIQGLFSAII